MGNRLSKITTRTGDDGETGLGDGSRCGKDDIRIQCIGETDELNSWSPLSVHCAGQWSVPGDSVRLLHCHRAG